MISTKSPASVLRCAAGSHSAFCCFQVSSVPTVTWRPSAYRTDNWARRPGADAGLPLPAEYQWWRKPKVFRAPATTISLTSVA